MPQGKSNKRGKIAVLCGGTSPEREVSLNTGRSVQKALTQAGFGADLLDWTEREVVEKHEILRDYDAVFIGYHGGAGEDGRVQAALELLGIGYTGSRPTACAIAMDKILSKRIFEQIGIPTPRWFAWEASFAPSVEELLRRCEFELPIVVKPPSQGSTVGITIARSNAQLAAGIKKARELEERILFEEFIPGREVTTAILEGEELPVVEIIPDGGFYDYEHKYTSGSSRYVVPAELPKRISDKLVHLGKKAFEALGLRHYGRVDFRLDGDKPFCLEVNALPGMTSLSLVPKAAAAAGIEFPELVGRIVKMV
ncbi:D-alanine--D-alanine ligase [bacterium]|nr:D-alanine--D-alanine ligase [bacterium]